MRARGAKEVLCDLPRPPQPIFGTSALPSSPSIPISPFTIIDNARNQHASFGQGRDRHRRRIGVRRGHRQAFRRGRREAHRQRHRRCRRQAASPPRSRRRTAKAAPPTSTPTSPRTARSRRWSMPALPLRPARHHGQTNAGIGASQHADARGAGGDGRQDPRGQRQGDLARSPPRRPGVPTAGRPASSSTRRRPAACAAAGPHRLQCVQGRRHHHDEVDGGPSWPPTTSASTRSGRSPARPAARDIHGRRHPENRAKFKASIPLGRPRRRATSPTPRSISPRTMPSSSPASRSRSTRDGCI